MVLLAACTDSTTDTIDAASAPDAVAPDAREADGGTPDPDASSAADAVAPADAEADAGAEPDASGEPDAAAPDAEDLDAAAPDSGAPFAVTPAITVGDRQACYLFADGRLKCWGSAFATTQQALGDGPGEMGANLPFLDFGPNGRVRRAVAGSQRVCVILEDGRLKCWGSNNQNAQLGSGDRSRYGGDPTALALLPPVDLGTGRTAIDVAAGWTHTCAVLDNGGVKCWGANTAGQLGLGDNVGRGGAPGEMGDALPFVDLGTGRTATAIAAGAYFTCALLDGGDVKCWGEGANGSPGSAATGGQLGQESFADIGDQPGEMGDNLPPINLGTGRSARSISCGSDLTCAVLDNGDLKCWGRNDGGGAIGAGDNNPHGSAPNTMGDALLPVRLGTARTATQADAGRYGACAILDDGRVKCWGSPQYLGLGLSGGGGIGDAAAEMGDDLPAVELGTGRTARAISLYEASTCAILDDETVKCWGAGSQGMLGQGSTNAIGDAPGEMGDALPPIALE
jgi:alpha-tubulin suppressor-like RCC1 family protein